MDYRDKISEEIIAKYRFTIKDAELRLEEHRNILALLPPLPIEKYSIYPLYGIDIDIPYDMVMFNRIKEIMYDSGWEISSDMETSPGYRIITFSHPECRRVRFCMNTDLEGSMCKLLKIGEKTVTEDVYKVVCNDEYQAAQGKI